MRSRAVTLVLVLLIAGGPVGGQEVADTTTRAPAPRDTTATPVPTESAWLIGGSFGIPGYGADAIPELFTLGLHWTQVGPAGKPGADLSLGTMPRVLAEALLVLGFRAGLAVPMVNRSGVLVLPSAGFSIIGGVGPRGGGGLGGVNAGIAGVFFGTGSTGLRTGITWHKFQDFQGAVWLIEVGVVGGRSSRR